MRVDVFDERNGRFAALRGRNVLIYWPHGFGDFVHFGYVAPLLEPANRYRITRFGDDFVHLYDGQDIVPPTYSGIPAPGIGPPGFEHLGIDFKKIRNREMEVAIPPPLSERFFIEGMDAILYTDYPEYAGTTAFPFHTKARALARRLLAPERLDEIDFTRPLKSALPFVAPDASRIAVEVRLGKAIAPERPFVLLAPGGHTNVGKSWPASEADRLRALLDARGVQTLTVSEGEFGALFGQLNVPFAHVLITLIRRADAFVGVAAGPLHAALAMGGRPIVGIWSRHYPDWYDEPCPTAVHFVGAEAIRNGLHRRAATLTRPDTFRDRIVHVDDTTVRAQTVDDALRAAGL